MSRNDAAETPAEGATVGEVASLLGVTVRTLHHWDSLGLATPSGRTAAGYRLYTSADVARLRRVLLYRELDVPLDRIAELLDDPAGAGSIQLNKQRERLRERIARLEQMAGLLDRLIEARETGILLPPEEQIAMFGEEWKPSWAEEARRRWGDTDAWSEYAEHAAERTAADWQKIAADTESLNGDLALAFRSGTSPGSERANVLAERHRASIGAYFTCTHVRHVCLGRMYACDPGFNEHYDRLATGLTEWLREIIDANARAHGVDPESATWE